MLWLDDDRDKHGDAWEPEPMSPPMVAKTLEGPVAYVARRLREGATEDVIEMELRTRRRK